MFQFVEHVASAGEVAEQHSLAVADRFGRDMLIRGRILEDGAHVDSAFVREGAAADVGLIVAHRQVGELGDKSRDSGQVHKLVAADGGVAEFQLEVRDDGRQVGTAAAFPVAVHGALDVRESGFYSGQRVSHGDIRIVVGVDAQDAVKALAHLGCDFRQARGDGAAVGIA